MNSWTNIPLVHELRQTPDLQHCRMAFEQWPVAVAHLLTDSCDASKYCNSMTIGHSRQPIQPSMCWPFGHISAIVVCRRVSQRLGMDYWIDVAAIEDAVNKIWAMWLPDSHTIERIGLVVAAVRFRKCPCCIAWTVDRGWAEPLWPSRCLALDGNNMSRVLRAIHLLHCHPDRALAAYCLMEARQVKSRMVMGSGDHGALLLRIYWMGREVVHLAWKWMVS